MLTFLDRISGNVVGVKVSGKLTHDDYQHLTAKFEGQGPIRAFVGWLVPGLVEVGFTLIGTLKLCGLATGVVGGADEPFVTKLCGT